jgi:transposase
MPPGRSTITGSITKAGDGGVRGALVQAALTFLTRDHRWCALKAWGMAVAKRRGLHRAIVAVARKLAVILHRIWIDGTIFTWSRDAAARRHERLAMTE